MSNQTQLLALNNDSFQAEVLESTISVVVDFWAQWCGPCRVMEPVISAVADDFNGKAKVVKVQIDDAEELATHYQIQGVPTLIFFKNGQVVDRLVGVNSKAASAAKLTSLLEARNTGTQS